MNVIFWMIIIFMTFIIFYPMLLTLCYLIAAVITSVESIYNSFNKKN